METPRRIGRRAVLLIAGASALGACTSSPPSPAPTRTSSADSATGSSASPALTTSERTASSPTAAPTSATTSAVSLPAPPAWVPNPNDVQPQVKLAAVQVVRAVLGYSPGGAGLAEARGRLASLGQDPGLLDRAPTLVGTGAGASVEVIDAQYGGILAGSASVLVACRQWVQGVDGQVAPGGTTVDVRLVRSTPQWNVTELHPADPGSAAPRLSQAAVQVLGSPHIAMPPAASADVRSGQVHDSVLTAMLALSSTFTIGVSVVRSGHPTAVFGTSRLSDHPLGRAFDTWQVDGRSVVDAETPRSLLTAYMQSVASAGSYNVGGPYALGGSTYFSDDTHHDHVHAGFTR